LGIPTTTANIREDGSASSPTDLTADNSVLLVGNGQSDELMEDYTASEENR
jgi:hypothetical protein